MRFADKKPIIKKEAAMNRSISFRRFQERKAKQKARRIQKMHWGDIDKNFTHVDRTIGILAGCHSKLCSCFMCGNPRQLGELTMQEKRHQAKMKEEFKQLGLAG